ncbi:amino acid adenylation domain-containing protein [Ochrobactrum grignonense]|nr:amino acid adenylation domain-containing protein [Brucella grignonensis]
MDRQVKIRGFRIELSEIEYTLSEHSMLNAVIVRVLGSGETSTIVAYVVKRDSKNADLTSRELQRFLYKKLPDYMVPSLFVFLDSFPLNANGKIDDAKLPLPLLDKNSRQVLLFRLAIMLSVISSGSGKNLEM